MNIDNLCKKCAYRSCNKEVIPCYSCSEANLLFVNTWQISQDEQDRIKKSIENNWN